MYPFNFELVAQRFQFALQASDPNAMSEHSTLLTDVAWFQSARGQAESAITTLDLVPDAAHQLPIAWAMSLVKADALRQLERHQYALKLAARVEREALDRYAITYSEPAWRARFLIGQIQAALNKDEEAATSFRMAADRVTQLAKTLPVVGARAFASWRRLEPLRALLRLRIRQGRHLDALKIADELSAQPLRELRQAAAISILPEDRRQSLRQAQLSFRHAEQAYELTRSRCHANNKRACTDLTLHRKRLKAASEALEQLIPAPDALRPWPSHLPNGTAVLSLLSAGKGRTLALLWVGATVSAFEADQPLAKVASHLHDIKTLFVVPNARQAGFNAAQFRVDGVPLGAKMRVSLLPSIETLFAANTARGGDTLVVADPENNLAAAAQEGQWLKKHIQRSKVLKSPVTRNDVLRLWGNVGFFHYAGHGIFDAEQLWRSFLKLNDATVTAEDVLFNQPSFSLAVLNACSTGVESEPGAIGFAQVLVLAGTTYVLTTVRAVEDEAALRFIRRFYEAGAQSTPAAAFQKAIERSVQEKDLNWTAFRLWGGRVEI